MYTYHGGIGGTCPASPAGFVVANSSLLTGMLCAITRPDGNRTEVFYQAPAPSNVVRLARVVNPGSQVADFGWSVPAGSNGKLVLTEVRTPFLADLLTAGKIAATDLWTIGYSAGRVASINAPIAAAGASTTEGVDQISWASLTETTVKLKNLDAIHGAAAWDRRVIFDQHARWTGDWNAFGATTAGSANNSRERTAVWNQPCAPTASCEAADVLLESRASGRMTSYIYDSRLWLTDTYGPADASCFNATTRLPNGTCTAPVVAHTHTDYDTTLSSGGTQVPMTGLSATNFATVGFTDRPVSVGTATTPTNFSLLWGSGALPGVTTDIWSTRLSGEINLPVGGAWGFWITMADPLDKAAVFIDDKVVIPYSSGVNQPCCGYVLYGVVPDGATAGLHKIRIDFSDGGGSAILQLNWNMPGLGNQVVPTSSLAPRSIRVGVTGPRKRGRTCRSCN